MFNCRMLVIVLIFIVLDILTGLLKGWKTNSLNSTKMRAGMIAKLSEFAACLFGFFVEMALPELGITIAIKFGPAICTYTVLMEICSIIENIGTVNEPVGKMLSHVFEKLREEYGDKEQDSE